MFQPSEIYPKVSQDWHLTNRGCSQSLKLFRRHYSCTNRAANYRISHSFVGPGFTMVLINSNASALFVWRKERFRKDSQVGINCSVFRREENCAAVASELIRQADTLAFAQWPGERHFTFVDAKKTRHKRDPGRCFRKAGWRVCGESKLGLLILERSVQ